jgi:hypothetical protein
MEENAQLTFNESPWLASRGITTESDVRFQSGITPVARSIACCVTLWKTKSKVSMNRCWDPGDAVGMRRL